MKDDLEEGGFACLLRYAPYMLEGVTFEVLGAAERAGVSVVELETSGWSEGIHGYPPGPKGRVRKWADDPNNEVGPQANRSEVGKADPPA